MRTIHERVDGSTDDGSEGVVGRAGGADEHVPAPQVAVQGGGDGVGPGHELSPCSCTFGAQHVGQDAIQCVSTQIPVSIASGTVQVFGSHATFHKRTLHATHVCGHPHVHLPELASEPFGGRPHHGTARTAAFRCSDLFLGRAAGGPCVAPSAGGPLLGGLVRTLWPGGRRPGPAVQVARSERALGARPGRGRARCRRPVRRASRPAGGAVPGREGTRARARCRCTCHRTGGGRSGPGGSDRRARDPSARACVRRSQSSGGPSPL
eukprot:scaffold308_cov327-Pavlova_lutheri.AAC.36